MVNVVHVWPCILTSRRFCLDGTAKEKAALARQRTQVSLGRQGGAECWPGVDDAIPHPVPAWMPGSGRKVCSSLVSYKKLRQYPAAWGPGNKLGPPCFTAGLFQGSSGAFGGGGWQKNSAPVFT